MRAFDQKNETKSVVTCLSENETRSYLFEVSSEGMKMVRLSWYLEVTTSFLMLQLASKETDDRFFYGELKLK